MTLQPIPRKSVLILATMLAFGPVLAGTILLKHGGNSTNQLVFWCIAAVSIVTGVVLGWALHNRSMTIERDGIAIKSTFYSRALKFTEMTDVERVAACGAQDVIGMRVNGVGLPGFQSGWFNAKPSGRVFVDRTNGDYLLLSVRGQPKIALGVVDTDATLTFLQQQLKRVK